MDRVALFVFLQHQNAVPLWVFRIIFDNDRFCDTSHNIPHENFVFGQLVITMI